MSDKQHIVAKLDDAEINKIYAMSVEDIEAKAYEAREIVSDILKGAQEMEGTPGRHSFKALAEKENCSEGDIKTKLARANAIFQACQEANIEKTQTQAYKATANSPVVGAEDKWAQGSSYEGFQGEPLFQALEKRYGVDKIDSFTHSDVKAHQFKGACYDDIVATVMTKGTGGSANPPTGITPNRPVQILNPYTVVDKRRNLADMLMRYRVTNDALKFRKEIESQASATPTPNYQAAEAAASFKQAIGSKEESVPVETIRAMVSLTNEQAADVPFARGYASRILARQLSDNTENQIFNGNGTSPNLTGIFSQTGTGTFGRADAETRKLLDFYIDAHKKYGLPRGADITNAAVGAGTSPTHIFLRDTDYRDLMAQKDGEGRYLWGDPVTGAMNSLWGTTLVVNDFVPADSGVMLNLDEQYLYMVMREGVSIFTGLNADDMDKNQFSIRISHRCAFVVVRPSTIFKLTNLDGKA